MDKAKLIKELELLYLPRLEKGRLYTVSNEQISYNMGQEYGDGYNKAIDTVINKIKTSQ